MKFAVHNWKPLYVNGLEQFYVEEWLKTSFEWHRSLSEGHRKSRLAVIGVKVTSSKKEFKGSDNSVKVIDNILIRFFFKLLIQQVLGPNGQTKGGQKGRKH